MSAFNELLNSLRLKGDQRSLLQDASPAGRRMLNQAADDSFVGPPVADQSVPPALAKYESFQPPLAEPQAFNPYAAPPDVTKAAQGFIPLEVPKGIALPPEGSLGSLPKTGTFTQASSRARTEATGGAARQAASDKSKLDNKTPDQLMQMLLGKEQDATKERDAARSKADKATQFSQEEKIAMALIGAIPGLLGTIAGGAIAGGWGAAAGAAGGLQGSASGFHQLISAKQDARKEALGEEKDAQGRIDMLGQQQMARAQHLGDQSFQKGLAEEQMAHSSAEGAANRRNMRGIALLNNEADLMKAQIAAGAKGAGAGGHPTDSEANSARYATRMLHSKAEIDRLTQEGFQPSSMGNTLEPVTPNFMLPKNLQQWTAAKRNWIAGNLRKDSGAAISDKEYAIDDKKYFPQPGDDPATIKEKARLRAAEEASMVNSAGRAGSYIVLPQQVTEQPGGGFQVSNKEYFGF